MINQSKSVILYIRVFIVLIIIGLLIPIVLNTVFIQSEKKNRDNCLYVITQTDDKKNFYDVFLEFWKKE